MNVVDSSAWLEFFAGSERSSRFEEAILDTERLIVPAICIYEVFKSICRQRSSTEALQAVAAMQQGQLVDVSLPLSLEAAQLSLDHALPMADALILATARAFDAVVWTQDSDFDGLSDVRYFPR